MRLPRLLLRLPGVRSNSITRYKSYWHGASSRPLLSITKYDALRRTAERKPQKTAIVSCHQNIEKTFSQFQKDVDELAAGLLSLNLPPGSMVAILAPNIYEWTVCQFATVKIGVALVNVNPAFQSQELKYILNLTQCKAIVVSDKFMMQDYYEVFEQLIPGLSLMNPKQIKATTLPHLKSIILIGDERRAGTMLYSDILASSNGELHSKADDINSRIDVDSTANVQLTSGTTGQPKAVPLSHHNIVNNGFTLGFLSGVAQDENASICLNVPLMHCFGCVIGSMKSVVHGAKLVMPSPRFNAKAALEAISAHKCTMVYGTPTMYVDMLSCMTSADYDLSSLKAGIMAGASCPPTLKQKVVDHMGIKTMHVAYGATELSPVVTFTKEDSLMIQPDTVGMAIDHVEIKIVDKQGNTVAFNEKGEVCSRGYQVFQGYLYQPEKTQEVFRNGWYRTGDEGSLTEEGLLTITGRIKDMIIRGGENIYPTEIENFFLSIAQIEEAHVVGVPDERMGEEVCAWVKLKQGQVITEQQIRDFCKGKISYFKVPKIIIFVDQFPKTVSGKIQKFKIREEMCSKLGISN